MIQKIHTHLLLIIIVLSFLINPLGLVVFDNKALKLRQDNSWSRIIKDGERFFYPRLEAYNNSIYVFGNIDIQMSSNYYFYIAKYSNSGILLWDVSMEESGFQYFSNAFDSEGNLIISLTRYSDKITLFKIDPFGQILLDIEIPIEESSHDISFKLDMNDSIYIIGHKYSPDEIFIYKFDENANLILNKSFGAGYYWPPWFLLSDSNNIYLPFYNNSLTIIQLNSSGNINWQVDLGEFDCYGLTLDANECIYLNIGDYDITHILKFNSSGNLIKEFALDNFHSENLYYFNDLIMITNAYENSKLICFDHNLINLWNFSLNQYTRPPPFFNFIEIAHDSQQNLLVLQNTYFGDISLLKINESGAFISQIIWGGQNDETLRGLDVDSEDNTYFICISEHLDVWGNERLYAVLTKNPLNGASPPLPLLIFDFNDYILFGFVGISLIISLTALISLLKKRKMRD